MTAMTSQESILFKGGVVLTLDPMLRDLPCGDVLVHGDRIIAVGSDLQAGGARTIDASGAIVLPGFVNAHQHAWLGLVRGLMPNVDKLDDYFTAIPFALGRYYRPQEMYNSTMLTSLSCLDAGITSILDASHNSLSPTHTDAAINAFATAGIRALHMVGKPVGASPVHWPRDIERLQESEAVAGQDLAKLGLFANVNDAEHWAVARKLDLRILTEFGGWGGGASPLPELQKKGLLGPDNVFNHCCLLSEAEWQILAETGVNVTVNPRSDALFGFEAGGFPYSTAIEHGIRPALGIDIDTAQTGDMFGEMRAAFYQQRSIAQTRRAGGDASAPAPVTVREILEASTIAGARVLGLEDKVGSLTPGKQADIIMVRADGIGVFPSHNAIGNVVHMVGRSDVRTVMVAGRIVKHEGVLVGVDLAAIRRATEESREHIFRMAEYVPQVIEDHFPVLKPAA
jgi:5-methylthioadenosine/S-adenosylhomocysteine deaminase